MHPKCSFYLITCLKYRSTTNYLFKNLALSDTTSQWFLTIYQIFKKSNDRIPRKHPEKQTDRTIDGQIWLGLLL